jgi:hypothetical protein
MNTIERLLIDSIGMVGIYVESFAGLSFRDEVNRFEFVYFRVVNERGAHFIKEDLNRMCLTQDDAGVRNIEALCRRRVGRISTFFMSERMSRDTCDFVPQFAHLEASGVVRIVFGISCHSNPR